MPTFSSASSPLLPRRTAERTIDRGIKRGKATLRTPPRSRLYTRTDAIGAVAEWSEAVDRADWTGRSSATDRRVRAAFGLIALKLGKVRFSASYRQIAEEAGVSVSSVNAALNRGLGGFVRRIRSGSRVQASSSEWQLVTRTLFANSRAFRYGKNPECSQNACLLTVPITTSGTAGLMVGASTARSLWAKA